VSAIPEDDPLVREALRVYRRYQVEIVEGLGMCPWAVRAREEGRVRTLVVLEREPSVAEALARIAELAADEGTDIGLLVYPRVALDRRAWEHFARDVHTADAARWPVGGIPMAMAAFHPDAEPDLSTPARFVPFVRRSPDPTLQLVRISVLERVRRAEPSGTGYVDPASLDLASLDLSGEAAPPVPLHERVARANVETARELGVARMGAMLDDILRDRDAAYVAIDETLPRRAKPSA
jgi:hypothetical protein